MSALAALAAKPAQRTSQPWAPPGGQENEIVAARAHGHSFQAIAEALTADGSPVTAGTVAKWLRANGTK